MPYLYDTFYIDDFENDNIYNDDRGDGLLQDIKEIIARINAYSPDSEYTKNRICNIELLLHGDYDCDGKKTGAPCVLSVCNSFCWQHAMGACR